MNLPNLPNLPNLLPLLVPLADSAASGFRAALDQFPFPQVNAALNGTSGVLLLVGFVCIRLRAVRAHAGFMIAAVVCSSLFLVSYLTYHFTRAGLTHFPEGPWRTTYLAILLTHTILAVVVVPLVIWTLALAARRRWAKHRRVAWVTFPIWLYVSVTGVVIYWMLYGWK